MKLRRAGATVGAALGAAVVLGACGAPKVALRYRFPPGRESFYRWTVEGSTTANGQGSHRLRLVFSVTEKVGTAPASGDGLLDLVLTPVEHVEDGQAGPPGSPLEIELEVASTGKVVKVRQAGDLPPGAVEALEVERLLSESRPPLPVARVAPRVPWDASLAARGESSSIELSGRGWITGFALRDGRRLAALEFSRTGEISSKQAVAQGSISLKGPSHLTLKALLDIDRGQMVEADSHLTANFDVMLGQTSAPGTLRVDLTTKVSLQGR